jgi:hypothetical protein
LKSKFTARDGKPLTLIARDEEGNVAKVESAMPLAKAEKTAADEEKLREQLGRLGGTPFKLGELKNFVRRSFTAGQRIEPPAPRVCRRNWKNSARNRNGGN